MKKIISPKVFALAQDWKAPESDRVWLSLTLNEVEPSEVVISGQIGKNWWDDSGTSGKEFRDAISKVPKGQKINLRINSEGGSVQDGLEIYNAIKERAADVTAHISGYAVSIASVIPLAAARVISPAASVWMIHEPWSATQGNAEEHIKAAEMLDKHGDMLAEIYSKEIGKSKKAMRDAMKKESWFTGSEAVEFGLADETGDDADSAKNLKRLDIKNFKNVPATVLNLISGVKAGQPQPKPQQENTMKKEKLVALLTQHGIKNSTTGKDFVEADSDADFEAGLTALAKKPGVDSQARMDDIENKLALAEKRRITDKINTYVDALKITKDEVEIYVEAAINNEAKTIEILDKKEAFSIGGDPIGFNRIEAGGAPVLAGYQGRASDMIANLWKENKTPQARYDALKENFHILHADAAARDRKSGRDIRAENTIAAGITTNFLITSAITQLGPQCVALKAFAIDRSVDPYKPRASGVQPFNSTVQDGSTTQKNPTVFTGGDAKIDAVTIAVDQYMEPLHLTNDQLNSGTAFAWLTEAKLKSLLSKIVQVVTAPITVANFATLAPLTINPAAFGFSDLATLQGQLKKSNIKNAILDGEYIARVANSPGFFQAAGVVGGLENAWKAFGWDLLGLNTEWQGADPFVRGFACNPQAIGVIAGLPKNPVEGIPGNVIQVGTAMLPGINVAIATYLWMDPNARTMRATYDIMLGANLVDASAGIIIKSQ